MFGEMFFFSLQIYLKAIVYIDGTRTKMKQNIFHWTFSNQDFSYFCQAIKCRSRRV